MRRSLILLYISIGWFLAIPSKNLYCQIPDGYSCKGFINAQLDQDCSFLLDPYEILIGEPPIEGLKIFVFDNNPSNRGIVECPGFYNFSVTNAGNAILCYGFVEVTDSRGPLPVDSIQVQDTLTCNTINTILNNPMTIEATINGAPNKYYLGEIIFEENCIDCGCEMTQNFQDQVDFSSCDNLPFFAKITRRWTAIDCNNQSTVVDQYFYLERPDFQDLIPVKDFQISTCEPDTVVNAIQYPFWIDTFGDTLYLNELDCNVDIDIQDQKIDKCGSLGFQLQRIYRVLDWCTGNSTDIDTIMIDIGDLELPFFNGNIIRLEEEDPNLILATIDRNSLLAYQSAGQLITFSTGPMDCTAGISLIKNNLETQFGFQIEDCGQVELDFQLFSYSSNRNSPWQINSIIDGAQFNSLTGILPGVYALHVIAKDECTNEGSGILLFEVQDQISPIARCKTSLSVELEEDAFSSLGLLAQLESAVLSDNSFDNCTTSQILVRRQVRDLSQCQDFFLQGAYDLNNDGIISELDFQDQNFNGTRDSFELGWSQEEEVWYSPWADHVDFYCCDQNQEIEVQLLVMDSAFSSLSEFFINNQTICTATIKVIKDQGPALSPLVDQEIYCTDAIFSLLEAGTYSETEDAELLEQIRNKLGGSTLSQVYCQNLVLQETFIPELENCGGGNILRIVHYEIPNQIGVPLRDSVVQIIQVKERFDYWIRFPEDQIANCSEDLPQAAIQFEQSTCDLLAVSVNDEPFFATENEGTCYKVFRTFQVVNWCEYDGEASPVVVSRDWDTWNGTDCTDQYNVNPLYPDGNGVPGDRPLYVIVKRNPGDAFVDTVYYDIDSNPYNQFPDDPNTTQVESYWWKVLSGHPDIEAAAYYENGLPCVNANPPGQSIVLPASWGQAFAEQGSELQNNRLGSHGFWRYTQHILINDNVAPNIEIIGEPVFCIKQGPDCMGMVDFELALYDECVGAARLSIRLLIDFYQDGENLQDFSNALDSNLFRADLPLGDHLLILFADDNCGNTRTQELSFSVVDCQAPSPLCLSGMTVELLPLTIDTLGQASIFAEDLVAESVYDCNGQGPEINEFGQNEIHSFSINRIGAPVLENQVSLNLTCEALGQTNIVEVHAWDKTGQHGFCESIITVIDPQGYCPNTGEGFISGSVQNVIDDPLSAVEMQLSGGNNRMMNSLEDGTYYFENLSYGRDYLVRPRFNGNALSGVSTFDILLIQQHIVGNLPITSPYLLIAADANNSGAISTLDMITLRKLILNIDAEFSNNQSWRFIDANYTFPDPLNPWVEVFPESILIEDLNTPLDAANFVGIKVGDVSGNALTFGKLINPRSATDIWQLKYPEQTLHAGQVYQIPFYGSLAELQGLQMNLQIDTKFVELLAVESDWIAPMNYKVSPPNGQVAFSWLKEFSKQSSGSKELFIIHLKCLKPISTASIFGLENHNLNPEAYQGFKVFPIALAAEIEASEVVLQQNFPNPFHNSTQIRVELQESGLVELEILDISGKIIQKRTQALLAGTNVFLVNSNDLKGPGVYYYRIKFKGESFSKRMINL